MRVLVLVVALGVVVGGSLGVPLPMDGADTNPQGRHARGEAVGFDFWDDPMSAETRGQYEAAERKEQRGTVTGTYRSTLQYTREEVSDKVTLVIKSFERASCVSKYVKSVRKLYPTMPILIADDSHKPNTTLSLVEGLDHVVVFEMPFDSGAAAARNFLLDHVTTPFVLVSDDDLLFTEHTSVETLLSDMESSGADVVGGCVDDGKGTECTGDFDMFLKDQLPELPKPGLDVEYTTLQWQPYAHHYMELVAQRDGHVNLTHSPFCKESDSVGRLFLARTAFVGLHNRYNPFFKVAEQFDFFFRAKLQQAYIRFCTSTKVLHRGTECMAAQEERDRYDRYENRWKSMIDYFFVLHPPISTLALPEGTLHWKCECDNPMSSWSAEQCERELRKRRDCRAFWLDRDQAYEEAEQDIVDGVAYSVTQPLPGLSAISMEHHNAMPSVLTVPEVPVGVPPVNASPNQSLMDT